MEPLKNLLERADAGVVLVDHRGYITRVNDKFLEIFGWKMEEILGRPLSVIIPPNLRDAHNLGFSRFLVSGKPTIMNRAIHLKAIAKDSRIFDAEHVIFSEQQNGQWIFGATIRPL